MKLDNFEVGEIKNAYKKLYLKSNEYIDFLNQREIILNKLVEDIFLERLEKLKENGGVISDDEKEAILCQLKELIKEWNTEFKEINKKIWWKFW